MAKTDGQNTKGQQEIKEGADQVKGGAGQAEAGAESIAAGVYNETRRNLARALALPGEAARAGRDVWRAGLGALSAAEEQGAEFYNDLVDRGRDLEQRGRDQINETARELDEQQRHAVKTVGDKAADTASAIEQVVNGAFRNVFGRLDVPTRSEVQSLADKVERLAEKLDGVAATLEKQQGGLAASAEIAATDLTAYHVSPHEEGWAVTKEGAERATSVYGTKKEAIEGGREFAKSHAPSELVVHKQDRSVQETFAYEGEAEA
jgi:poly(hydroxyalkanoate) granule-associated protein